MTSKADKPKRFVIVRDDCLHPEKLRGQIGVLIKQYEDGSVCVLFEDGPHAGDRVCMPGDCIEALS